MDTNPELRARVATVIAAAGVEATPHAEGLLLAWVEKVKVWNARIDLTAARSDDELVDLMVADAAQLARLVAREASPPRVVDVGAGAGAPGLGLALLRPELRLTLVEPLQKRVSFLRNVQTSLPAAAVELAIVRGRGEDLVARGHAFDVAISRATLPPPAWLELGARLAPSVWVLLAKEPPPAREGLRAVEDHRYTWPLTGAERRLVRYQREDA